MENDAKKVDIERLNRFAKKVLISSGSDPQEAGIVADILVWGDAVGRPNQGVWRLPIISKRLKMKLYNTPCHLTIDMKTDSLGVVDGNVGLGHYVAFKSMQKTIATARDQGIGVFSVRNSNFYGAGGYYAAMAANAGMLGISLSNSFPKVRAFNGVDAVLGTNPISFSCPARDNEPLIVDMATSEMAGSTLRKKYEKNNVRKDESPVLEPFGGPKGYGLGLMVEIMSGVLSGSGISHQVKSMYENFDEPGNNGHFFLAINIEKFISPQRFKEIMSTLLSYIFESGDKSHRVQYPGQNRWCAYKASHEEGVELDKKTHESLAILARDLKIQPL